jgi:hypothetical protein
MEDRMKEHLIMIHQPETQEECRKLQKENCKFCLFFVPPAPPQDCVIFKETNLDKKMKEGRTR